MERPFLTARWESLLLLNYECPREILAPLVPHGTELDPWNGVDIVSVVGFMFRDTKVWGVSIPGHRTFEEVNLRFYVKRSTPEGEVRRGVVFVRELVPRGVIAWVARTLYNEPYEAVPMRHHLSLCNESGGSVEYGWDHRGKRFSMAAEVTGRAVDLETGSEAEFITEHYWGYNRQRDGRTMEYQVDHPPWKVWTAASSHFQGDATLLYGSAFAPVLSAVPRSTFVAVGSEIAVYKGRVLEDPKS